MDGQTPEWLAAIKIVSGYNRQSVAGGKVPLRRLFFLVEAALHSP